MKRRTSFIKPPKFKNHLTLTEVSDRVELHPRWIRRLEADGRIPKASRVTWGKLKVRLWSPAQVREIEKIVATHRPGRTSNG